MTKLYRVLGKRGRITIPFEIRQRVGFTYNDVLSFTESPDGRTVTVKREKICDNCSGTKTADKETEMTLEDFLDSLSAEQQRVALVHLSVKWAEQKAGGHNTVSFFYRTTDCDRILLQSRVEHTFNRRIKVVHIAMQY